jgi:hypothetical protein
VRIDCRGKAPERVVTLILQQLDAYPK